MRTLNVRNAEKLLAKSIGLIMVVKVKEVKIMRRRGAPTYGNRFVGNTDKKEVHDLDNEQTGANECQIDEIIRAGHARIFDPDTHEQARKEGYDNCAYCLGGSER